MAKSRKLDRISELMRAHRPQPMPCSCVSIGIIIVKSGVASKYSPPVAPRIVPDRVPFQCRTLGAQRQDQLYGRGMRLHNPRFGGKPKKHIGWTCTVCGHQVTTS